MPGVDANGRRVMGYTQWAAFAEKTVAHRDLLWPVPENWTRGAGRCFPGEFLHRLLGLLESGTCSRNRQGARVLIHAVAGGVGTAAVQIGKILGIEMYGTSSSEEKLARVRELGLQHGINYKQRDYVEAIKELTQGEGVDAVFEMLGGEHVAKSVKCVRDFGRVIVYGAATGETPQLDTRVLYAKGASVHGLWLSYLSAESCADGIGVEAAFGMDRRGQTASGDRESFSARAGARRLHAAARRQELRQDCAEDFVKRRECASRIEALFISLFLIFR